MTDRLERFDLKTSKLDLLKKKRHLHLECPWGESLSWEECGQCITAGISILLMGIRLGETSMDYSTETVQIMIGVMVFFLGVVLTENFLRFVTISAISGITIWGSFIYISAGSLSVAAQNKLNPCVVKASLGMNVISAITAGISIILMGADIGITQLNCSHYYNRNNDCISQRFGSGILGILLMFFILQFIISIFISAFACKATNSTNPTVVSVALNQGY